jgi:hypothetical protein
MGMLVANIVDGGVTLYRNLLAHNDRRSPRPGGQPGGHPGLRLDFVNNVIYDWGQYAGSGGLDDEHIRLNYVGNYLLAGPSTILSQLGHAFVHYSTDTRVYQQGNLIDSNRDGQLNGVNTGWSMFSNVYTAELIRFDFPLVPTLDAPSAYQSVLAEVGASHARDEVDWRIIGQVTGQTGGIISNPTEVGGYPVLENITPPLDSDGDGMADWWEDLRSLDRHNPEDRNDKPDDSGYTNLELYLDCLVDPACVGVLPGESWSVF